MLAFDHDILRKRSNNGGGVGVAQTVRVPSYGGGRVNVYSG